MPTIEQFAIAAGVSTATVSRALSNPKIVREPTRRKVQEAIRKLGYSPNAAAKSLRTLRTGKLLVTVPDCEPACNSDQAGVRTEPWTGLGCISEVRAVLHGTA